MPNLSKQNQIFTKLTGTICWWAELAKPTKKISCLVVLVEFSLVGVVVNPTFSKYPA